MEILIECPECGFNRYYANDLKTNENVFLDIGKCSETECEIVIYNVSNNKLTNTHQFSEFSELTAFIKNNYNLIEVVDGSC